MSELLFKYKNLDSTYDDFLANKDGKYVNPRCYSIRNLKGFSANFSNSALDKCLRSLGNRRFGRDFFVIRNDGEVQAYNHILISTQDDKVQFQNNRWILKTDGPDLFIDYTYMPKLGGIDNEVKSENLEEQNDSVNLKDDGNLLSIFYLSDHNPSFVKGCRYFKSGDSYSLNSVVDEYSKPLSKPNSPISLIDLHRSEENPGWELDENRILLHKETNEPQVINWKGRQRVFHGNIKELITFPVVIPEDWVNTQILNVSYLTDERSYLGEPWRTWYRDLNLSYSISGQGKFVV